MTAQLLASELTALIQDTKRKNADIRAAAEKSLADLKALPNTSESQLAADLRRRPNFVRPLVLACASKNAKFAGTAVTSLQRLVASNALAVETLRDTLEVLRECTGFAQDIQLKILQIVPSLLQNYGSHIQKELLVLVVHICCILLVSKTAVISNTAAATLQQLVVGILGKVVKEDEESKSHDFVAEVPIENGSISVMPAALDAYRLLDDICLLLEGDRPAFLQPTSMSPSLGMELVEAMISSHPATIASHPELVHILRARLLPFVIRIISENKPFPITVRVVRVLPIIFSNMLSALPAECEIILSLLNHMLELDSSVGWKRVLCMEVFRIVHGDASLMRSIYAHFDEQEGKRTVVKDHLAMLVKISAEKPAIIGLGPQSTIPASSGQTEEEINEMAAIQADGIGGTIGVAMTLRASTAPGISARLSVMRVPCLEQLDKGDAPQIPPAYLYTLALICMNQFSENLAKFLLPFTVPVELRSKRRLKQGATDSPRPETPDGDKPDDQRTETEGAKAAGTNSKVPLNPLMLESHPKHGQIKTSASMIEACWPALLAAYSTFFHAALDSEYYHALVRSFQKFTQVAGLLRLSTPRDAFLTTLGKNAVPSSVISLQTPQQTMLVSEAKDARRGSKTPLPQTPSPDNRSENASASLNTRNLLCLRALLNLGIALGPVLQAAWSILLETLQQADLIINHVHSQRRHNRSASITTTSANSSEADLLGDIGSEIAAVKVAANRMLESSVDLPEEAFLDIVASMSGLLRNLTDTEDTEKSSKQITASKGQPVTATTIGGSQDPYANLFVVENLGKIIEYNRPRFLEDTTQHNGWHIFVNSFLGIISAPHFDADIRLRAAQGLNDLVLLTASLEVSPKTRDEMRQEGLMAISRQIESLSRKRRGQKAGKTCELDIQYMSLETLRSLLEQFGDSLAVGWPEVFTIITSVFHEPSPEAEAAPTESQMKHSKSVLSKSPKLTRSSFGSLQLICSDFLATVPSECFTILLDTIHSFCLQQDDFNISLTSTSLFCNVSDHLWQGEEDLHLDAFREKEQPDLDSITIQSFENMKAEMLLRLLLLLVDVTVDKRLEIRHGAIHAVFRIFDACGEKLSPDDWLVALRQIILSLFGHNQESYSHASSAKDSGEQNSDLLSWNEAAAVLLDNSATLLGNNINVLLSKDNFSGIWSDLITHLQAFIDRQDLTLSAKVFTMLEKVLVSITEPNRRRFSGCTTTTWDLWRDGNPAEHRSTGKRDVNNQEALVAYLHCLAAMRPLLARDPALERLRTILTQLQVSVTQSSQTNYSDDVDTLTTLQAQAISHLENLNDDIPNSVSEIIIATAYFITLTFRQDPDGSMKGGPTFVALSKAAMDVLGRLLLKHASDSDIYHDGSFLAAISALVVPISLKYKWRNESKLPTTWQQATSTAGQILAITIPSQAQVNIDASATSEIWSSILSVADSIVRADEALSRKPISEAPEDQTFDIAAFEKLYSLIVPALGNSSISHRLRRSFARSLFENSHIHMPHPDDLPETDSSDIISNLKSNHIGRTERLQPTRRSRMAYICLDKLIDLVRMHDGSPARVVLAQAAAPYLILRIGIVLKAYILDQPLRGNMPMAASQKKELLYVLQEAVDLRCESKAIPDAPGIVSSEKKHLYRVYALVNQALKVCGRDRVIYNALMRVVEVCAMDFGLD